MLFSFCFARRLAILGMMTTAWAAAAGGADTPTTKKELTNSIGMQLTAIPAGEFVMGATPGEISERTAQLRKNGEEAEEFPESQKEMIALTESEGPQHRVTISQGFWLGTHEVTQSEFQAVMGFNPSGAHSATGTRARMMAGTDTRRHPVEKVSWDDAVEFCRQLSNLEEEAAAGRTYRLPTEAEWEFAYRAGTASQFYWGDAGRGEIRERLSYQKLSAGEKSSTVAVGRLDPNPWGLFDMTGNVREWCADWYDAKTYSPEPVRDPAGPAAGVERTLRGGKTYFFLPAIRSATRNKHAPAAPNMFIGFRVACDVRPVVAAAPGGSLAQIEATLKQKGLVRRGNLFILADETDFSRYSTTLERMRVACFNAKREVDDAKQQLQRLSAAQAGALQARIDARNTMRYSDTWREHRYGVISRNVAADALALVNMSRDSIEQWLADAEADFDNAVKQFAAQCGTLREMHGRLLEKQRDIAAEPDVTKALAAATAGGKVSYRFGPGPNSTASLKKLEYEESVLKQLRAR